MLAVALRTVEAHRSHVLQKLGLTTRAEIVQYVSENSHVRAVEELRSHIPWPREPDRQFGNFAGKHCSGFPQRNAKCFSQCCVRLTYLR